MTADWLDPCLDAAQMREDDRWAIEDQGVPSLDLMETAGIALAGKTESLVQAGQRILVVCGKGNNGGDGLVAARILGERGHEVETVLVGGGEGVTPDSKVNLDRLGSFRDAPDGRIGEILPDFEVVIDAIFGTGFSGEPRDAAAAAISSLNEASSTVIAADIPSGVNASTGEITGSAVEAAATVTFHMSKIGHWVAPGRWVRGDLEVAPIGIPSGAPAIPYAGLISDRVLSLPPTRSAASNKFTAGKVVICGGSRGLTGAVCLSATAAIRSGAGYATVVVPAELEQIFEVKLTEVMSVGCPSREGVFRGAAEEQIVAACEGADAIVFGPGIGREPSLERLLRSLISRLSSPLVIDADAFQALSGALALISERRQPTVITPHAGELARLLEKDSTQVAEHRLESALEAARISKAVVVSKGDDTIVTDGDRIAINPFSTPGLATAGTGDILAGMIGAMLSRGLDPFEAACVAVKAHSRAGLAAVDRVGVDSVIAGDVLEAIPEGLKR